MRYVKVEVPEGVNISVDGTKVSVEGPKGKVEKVFKARDVKIEVVDGRVEVESKDRAMVNTIKAHIRNMIKGVTEGHSREMVVRYAHFPMKLNVKGNVLEIENFLGERKPRQARIMDGAQVKVKGSNVVVEGADIEAVTQTVANIRQATKIKRRDERIFQDGIYPVEV